MHIRRVFALLFSLIIIAAVIALVLIQQKRGGRGQNERPSSAMYKGFGTRIPKGYPIMGIDISRYQSTVNFKLLAAMREQKHRVHFVFIKATEGKGVKDPQFARNWTESKKHRLVRGAYHYWRPKSSASEQIKLFTQMVKLEKGDLPPVLDLEEEGGLSPDSWRKAATEMLTALEKHYKVKPIIYCNYDFYRRLIKGHFKGYQIWIAHYYVSKPGINDWTFWQFTDKATVDGITHKVDMNVFNGDSAAMQKLLLR